MYWLFEARKRYGLCILNYIVSIEDKAHKSLLKVEQTTREKQRIAEQLKTAAIKNYKIELDESAERDDGTLFTDHHVRSTLVRKGFENAELEFWGHP